MHDIKWIDANPDKFDAGLARRGLPPMAQELRNLYVKEKGSKHSLQELQARKNQIAKLIGEAKSRGEHPADLFEEAKLVKKAIEDASNDDGLREHLETAATSLLQKKLNEIPNIPAEDVPNGKDEHDNKMVREWGTKKTFSFKPKEHFELGEKLGMMDFETAAKMSGARFVLLSGALARLERALASFFLDNNIAAGYTECVPPFLVRDNAAFGTGQLPKFGEDLFRTTNGFWLIPTAEVPLTNIVADRIVEEDDLPRRYTAYTPCFRSEAGAAGKDTRGMIRQHQFSKVELVSITTPEQSVAEHERMTAQAESLLQKLGLAYRTMLLCTGDMGFGSQKTYDIEVWLPGQNAYREISSCSNCGDFQARRMKARFKAKGAKETQFVHTLNGSGLPIGRTIVAILENYQQEDGSILVPDALKPYMQMDIIK